MTVSTEDLGEGPGRSAPEEYAASSLPRNSRLTIHMSLGEEYLGCFTDDPESDINPFALLEEGFSDDRKERIHNMLWNATLGGSLALAPMGRRPARITELGLGGSAFVCDIARRNPKVPVHTVNYFGSRNPAAFPQDMANPPRVISRNLEMGDWGHDPRIQGRQGLVAARFEADGLDWNWRHIAQQSLAALKPGGWLEIQMVGQLTSDDGSADGTALAAISQHLSKHQHHHTDGEQQQQRFRLDGHDGNDDDEEAVAGGDQQAAALERAGFDEIAVLRRLWWSSPVGHRHDVSRDEAGLARMYLDELEAAQLLEAQCDEIKTYLRWTPEEAEDFLRTVKEEIRDPSIQAYFPVYIIYGRKPST